MALSRRVFWIDSEGRFLTSERIQSNCKEGIHEADLVQDYYGEQHCKYCKRWLPRGLGEFGE